MSLTLVCLLNFREPSLITEPKLVIPLPVTLYYNYLFDFINNICCYKITLFNYLVFCLPIRMSYGEKGGLFCHAHHYILSAQNSARYLEGTQQILVE